MLWGFSEKSDFYGGVHEKPIYGGNRLKSSVWTVCRFNGGARAWQKRGGGVFEEGG